MAAMSDFLRKVFGKKPSGAGGNGAPKYEPMAFKMLMARVRRVGNLHDQTGPAPLVTLEEFFEGNYDPQSIGGKSKPRLAPQVYYDCFRAIRARAEVQDVRVMVVSQDNLSDWPFADTIWVITSASEDTLKEWLGEQPFGYDFIPGFDEDAIPLEPYSIPKGMRAIGVWLE